MLNVLTGMPSPSEKSCAFVLESMPPDRNTPTGTSLTLRRLHRRAQLGEQPLGDLVFAHAVERLDVIPGVPVPLFLDRGRRPSMRSHVPGGSL